MANNIYRRPMPQPTMAQPRVAVPDKPYMNRPNMPQSEIDHNKAYYNNRPFQIPGTQMYMKYGPNGQGGQKITADEYQRLTTQPQASNSVAPQQNRPYIPPFKGPAAPNISTVPFKGAAPSNQQVQPGVIRNPQTGQVSRTSTGVTPRPNWNPQSSPEALQGQKARLENRLAKAKPEVKDALQKRLDKVNKRLGPETGGPSMSEPSPVNALPTDGEVDWKQGPVDKQMPPLDSIIGEGGFNPKLAPGVEGGDEYAKPSPVNDDGTFRGIRDFETDFQDDPIFKASLEKGQTAMNRLLSSRGLVNSGAEVEANAQLLGNLTTDLGSKYLDVAREDANRWDSQNENESNRLERREDAQWGRYRDMLEAMLGQNPMPYTQPITEDYTKMIGDKADARAKRRADKYKRVQGPSGGGGGAAGPGPFVPPYPSAPYTGDIDLAKRLGEGAGQQDWLNQIIGLGSGLIDLI